MSAFDIFLILFWFGIPLASITWIVISVIRYVKADKNDLRLREHRRNLVIASSVIGGTLTAGVIALFVLLMLAIAHM